jgi:Tfp pilus assembly protein PilO
MTLSKREKIIFIVTVVLIISAVSYSLIIETLLEKWKAVDNDIKIKQVAFKKGVKLLKDRNSIITDYNKYASSVRNISNVLSYIERQADSLGIKTSNIKPRPVVQRGDYKEYVIEVQIEGELSAVTKFISNLIKPPGLITVKNFSLRMQEEPASYLKGTLILSKLMI